MRGSVKVALGALEFAGNVAGVPLAGTAAVLVKEIADFSQQTQTYKEKSKRMANSCTQLYNSIQDLDGRLTGTELQTAVDEITEYDLATSASWCSRPSSVLERIHKRTRKYAGYNLVQRYWKADRISKGIDTCEHELNAAINRFGINAHIMHFAQQRDSHAVVLRELAEQKDLLLQILGDRVELEHVVAMQSQGERVAEIIMEDGQRELMNLRDAHSSNSGETLTEPERQERYQQYEAGLTALHEFTGIPPTVKILDGEVTKVGDIAFSGGPYSDVWEGKWLNGGKVALKCLRNIKTSDPKGKKRFEREIKVWDTLKNENILPFYGICTNIGWNIHMVSPWQENGDVLAYVKEHPNADKMFLLLGAAKGLEYLHDVGVVHGNVKCANILVLQDGTACISDFGVAKGMRVGWPQKLIDSTDNELAVTSPTKKTDVYSYGMSMLELITEKRPWSECKREVMVILNVISKKTTPSRPKDVALSDELWALMEDCWKRDSATRPDMEQVRERLQLLSTAVNV
ncbi:TKL/TKL-ccin protein kinase [Hymenopellis radicata]|nr:TKL/TKL-ccin protein kinase [Hymenopellis radicata]